jgi:hypothetical protein
MTDQPNLFLLTEAAEHTGLSVDALRKRIKRGKLEVVKGNDGLVRVRLTSADLDALRLGDGRTGQPETSQATEVGQAINALEDAVTALRERAEKAEQRADRAEAELVTERGRGGEAQVRAASAEAEAKALRDALGRERDRADRVEAEARRPFWRRWLGS